MADSPIFHNSLQYNVKVLCKYNVRKRKNHTLRQNNLHRLRFEELVFPNRTGKRGRAAVAVIDDLPAKNRRQVLRTKGALFEIQDGIESKNLP